jgi:murein DD-endopeptidase MepM/ murein hydrolase activator NlpD
MKFIWGKKEFTFMIVRGANSRIIRIKLPQSILILAPTFTCLTVIGFIAAIYLQNIYFAQSAEQLSQTYQSEESNLSKEIAAKTSEIQNLQQRLFTLTEQTKEFQTKVDEIKRLNNVMKSAPADTNLKSSTSSPSPNSALPAIGGTDEPVSDNAMHQLLDQTGTNLTAMVNDISELLTELTATEAELAQAQKKRDMTPSIWPTRSHHITSTFGIRLDPFTGKVSMHTGLDLDGELRDPILAAAEGTVVAAGWHPDFGYHIQIDHGGGLRTEYMHLSKIIAEKGNVVKKGQIIGLMGSTGRSTGTHLHYEVQVNGVKVNPMPYLKS